MLVRPSGREEPLPLVHALRERVGQEDLAVVGVAVVAGLEGFPILPHLSGGGLGLGLQARLGKGSRGDTMGPCSLLVPSLLETREPRKVRAEQK